jgi:hypothetical protein
MVTTPTPLQARVLRAYATGDWPDAFPKGWDASVRSCVRKGWLEPTGKVGPSYRVTAAGREALGLDDILTRQDAAERIGLFRDGRLVEVLQRSSDGSLGVGEEVLTLCLRHPDSSVVDCVVCDVEEK